MQSMKHIIWPAVLLMATTTVGFAQGKPSNSSPKYDVKQKYDGCDRKGEREHDKDHGKKYDRDCDHDSNRGQDHSYRDNSQSVTTSTTNS